MYSESPIPSPTDVACYEECATDDTFFADSPTSAVATCSASKSVPKLGSGGRITKRGELQFVSAFTWADVGR